MKHNLLFIFLLFTVIMYGQTRSSFSDVAAELKISNVTPKVAAIDTLHYMTGNPALYTFTGGNGYIYGTNNYGDLGKYQRFDITIPYTLSGAFAAFGKRTVVGTPDILTFVVKAVGANGAPGALLHSHTVTSDQITPSAYTTFNINPPVVISDSIFVGFEWTVAADDSFALLSDLQGGGDNAARVWEKWSDGAFSSVASSVGLNADIWVGIVVDDVVAPTVISIAEAREDLDNNLIPDKLNDTVTVRGIVTSPNYQTSNHSYYLDDGTAGIVTFLGGTTSPSLALGDEVEVTGKIGQFNGLTQLQPFASSDFKILSSGNSVPDYMVLTLAQFFANPEFYEARLVAFKNLVKVSGTWPATGSVTLFYSDAVDTIEIRIDSDTDIDGSVEPTGPTDIIGLASQFNTYQILPRYRATDFLPGGTIPVELTSFAANVTGDNVTLSWFTASETNNKGFFVERKSGSDEFVAVIFIDGKGTTTEVQSYSYSETLPAGKYSYRLKQVDFDGTFYYSKAVEADVALPSEYNLGQNFPNPFNPATTISFNLPVDAKVKLSLFDVLGREIKQVVDNNLAAGNHKYNIIMNEISSGVYFYRLEANGVDGSKFSSFKKMILSK